MANGIYRLARPSTMRFTLLLSPLIVGAGVYLYHAKRTPPFTITFDDHHVRDIQNSKPTRLYVNPNGHQMYGETHSIKVQGSDFRSTAGTLGGKDGRGELLLSKFLHGFFGGWVFAPESILLKRLYNGDELAGILARGSDADSEDSKSKVAIPPILWIAPSPSMPLPDFGQIYFGAFAAISTGVEDFSNGETTVLVDICFQTSERFAGLHRLSVTQSSHTRDGPVTLSITSAMCDPKEDTRPAALGRFIYPIHLFYKDQLFRDAVSAVLEG